jgi:anti-sigma B factor antagonist
VRRSELSRRADVVRQQLHQTNIALRNTRSSCGLSFSAVYVETRERLDRDPMALDPPTGSIGPALAQQLAIECHQDAQSVVLVLRGEIDLASAPQLEHALVDAVSRASRIVIDLAAVEFIDSIGVATLFHAQRHADANGHALILRQIPPRARQLFDLTGVAGAFVTD